MFAQLVIFLLTPSLISDTLNPIYLRKEYLHCSPNRIVVAMGTIYRIIYIVQSDLWEFVPNALYNNPSNISLKPLVSDWVFVIISPEDIGITYVLILTVLSCFDPVLNYYMSRWLMFRDHALTSNIFVLVFHCVSL